MHSVVQTMMMAQQWRQRWSGGGDGDGAEAVEWQRQQRWRSAPAAATTAATTRTMTAAAAAKATMMATAAASGRHGESSSVLAAGARMETSDKFRGEPVDCCLCLCPPPSRCCRCVAAIASPPLRRRRCHPCCRHPRCPRRHRRRRFCCRLVVGRWREDGWQQSKRRRLWLRLQYAQNCRYDNVRRCGPTNDRGTPGKQGSPPSRSIFRAAPLERQRRRQRVLSIA